MDARHRDERRRAHPVGAGGHAVEEGGYLAAGDVVLVELLGEVRDTDDRVQAKAEQNEEDADEASSIGGVAKPGPDFEVHDDADDQQQGDEKQSVALEQLGLEGLAFGARHLLRADFGGHCG